MMTAAHMLSFTDIPVRATVAEAEAAFLQELWNKNETKDGTEEREFLRLSCRCRNANGATAVQKAPVQLPAELSSTCSAGPQAFRLGING